MRLRRVASMTGAWYILACIGLLFLSSCSMLDKEVPIFDQETGEQVGTTTVGDMLADNSEDVAGNVVGMLTGNPILGAGAAAAAAGLFSGLRRRKKMPTAQPESPPPGPVA